MYREAEHPRIALNIETLIARNLNGVQYRMCDIQQQLYAISSTSNKNRAEGVCAEFSYAQLFGCQTLSGRHQELLSTFQAL